MLPGVSRAVFINLKMIKDKLNRHGDFERYESALAVVCLDFAFGHRVWPRIISSLGHFKLAPRDGYTIL